MGDSIIKGRDSNEFKESTKCKFNIDQNCSSLMASKLFRWTEVALAKLSLQFRCLL